MSRARSLVMVAIVGVLALVVGGCSSSGASSAASPSSSPSPSASPLTVQEHLVQTTGLLTQAISAYQAGKDNQALDLVDEAYLDHFEFVEGPLEAVDAELKESIEDKTRTDLRGLISAGKPAADVTALGTEILGLLGQAADKLK